MFKTKYLIFGSVLAFLFVVVSVVVPAMAQVSVPEGQPRPCVDEVYATSQRICQAVQSLTGESPLLPVDCAELNGKLTSETECVEAEYKAGKFPNDILPKCTDPEKWALTKNGIVCANYDAIPVCALDRSGSPRDAQTPCKLQDCLAGQSSHINNPCTDDIKIRNRQQMMDQFAQKGVNPNKPAVPSQQFQQQPQISQQNQQQQFQQNQQFNQQQPGFPQQRIQLPQQTTPRFLGEKLRRDIAEGRLSVDTLISCKQLGGRILKASECLNIIEGQIDQQQPDQQPAQPKIIAPTIRNSGVALALKGLKLASKMQSSLEKTYKKAKGKTKKLAAVRSIAKKLPTLCRYISSGDDEEYLDENAFNCDVFVADLSEPIGEALQAKDHELAYESTVAALESFGEVFTQGSE